MKSEIKVPSYVLSTDIEKIYKELNEKGFAIFEFKNKFCVLELAVMLVVAEGEISISVKTLSRSETKVILS